MTPCFSRRCALWCALLLSPAICQAHGFVGNRFFPPTLTTEDPFAVDELSLGGVYFHNAGGDDEASSQQLSGGFEFVKEVFPRFAVGFSENYFRIDPLRERRISGWDNLGISLKYEAWQNDEHEAIVSVGLDTDLGGTGARRVSESSTTFVPTLYFGKGFGDLPTQFWAFQPIALTGTVGQTFSTDAHAPNTLETGLSLQYSLPYLQQHVRDMGLPSPFKNMIPLIELSLSTQENRGPRTTTGTVNPGVLWEAGQVQLGIEALIPINRDSGTHVGVAASLQIYIDDLLPSVFGHPLFGER